MDKVKSYPSWSKWYQPGSEEDAYVPMSYWQITRLYHSTNICASVIYASALQTCKDINEKLNSQPWWDSQPRLVATKVVESAPILLRQPKTYSAAWVESLIRKESERIKDRQASKHELLKRLDSSAHVLIKIAMQLKPILDIFIPQSPEYSIPYACLWAIFKVCDDDNHTIAGNRH